MGRKKKRKYFDEKEEEAVIQYNLTEDEVEKNIIWERVLHKPIKKMSEIITKRYCPYYGIEGLEEMTIKCFLHGFENIKNYRPFIVRYKQKDEEKWLSHPTLRFFFQEDLTECIYNLENDILLLCDTLDKIDDETNINYVFDVFKSKAYSYLGTIMRNFVTTTAKELYNKEINSDAITELDLDSVEEKITTHYNPEIENEKPFIDVIIDDLVNVIQEKIDNDLLNKNEKILGHALIVVLTEYHNLFEDTTYTTLEYTKKGRIKKQKYTNIYSKTKVNYLLKELTNFNNKELISTMKTFKDIFKELKLDLVD